jgi:hypothetical protein
MKIIKFFLLSFFANLCSMEFYVEDSKSKVCPSALTQRLWDEAQKNVGVPQDLCVDILIEDNVFSALSAVASYCTETKKSYITPCLNDMLKDYDTVGVLRYCLHHEAVHELRDIDGVLSLREEAEEQLADLVAAVVCDCYKCVGAVARHLERMGDDGKRLARGYLLPGQLFEIARHLKKEGRVCGYHQSLLQKSKVWIYSFFQK